MENIYLTAVTNHALQGGALSEEEATQIQYRLGMLLAQRAARYTMNESSSIPEETAESILKSICFSIDLYLKATGDTNLLRTQPMPELLDSAWRTLERYISKGKVLLRRAAVTAPPIDSFSYSETLKELRAFFRRYDYRFFAHDIPCGIDYQLSQPVSEELLGIEYICEYLRRLITENEFCNQFEPQAVSALLERACPEYCELLINLYEPVAVNAIGLTLLKKETSSLAISVEDCAVLLADFSGCKSSEALQRLTDAADRLCRTLQLSDSVLQAYLRQTAADIWPRLQMAAKHGDLSKLFV